MKYYNKYILLILLFAGIGFWIIKFGGRGISSTLPPVECNITPTSVPDLPIPPIAQQSNQWCWAASLEMVIDYYKPELDISQCQIATKRIELFRPIGMTTVDEACNCSVSNEGCQLFNSISGNCKFYITGLNSRSMVSIIQGLLNFYDLKGELIPNNKLNTLDNIKLHLSMNHPVIGFYMNPSRGNHIVVIKGYTDVDSTGTLIPTSSYLFINNPLYNKKANCNYCYHWILTGCFGQNIYPNTSASAGRGYDLGTYRSINYLAIIPKPVTP